MRCRHIVGPALLFLASSAFADRYVECDPAVQSCGGDGNVLWMLIKIAALICAALGACFLFLVGPGALWNRLTGRGWDDNKGIEGWMTVWGMVLPMLAVSAMPALLVVRIVDMIFGPFEFGPYVACVVLWWGYLWHLLKRSAGEATRESPSDDPPVQRNETQTEASPALDPAPEKPRSRGDIREVSTRAIHGRAPIDLGRPVGAAHWMPEPAFVDVQPHIAGVIVVQLWEDFAYVALYGPSLKATCRDFTVWWREHKDNPPPGWAGLMDSCDLESAQVVESEHRFPSSLRSSAELLLANRRKRGASCATWGSPLDYTAPS